MIYQQGSKRKLEVQTSHFWKKQQPSLGCSPAGREELRGVVEVGTTGVEEHTWSPQVFLKHQEVAWQLQKMMEQNMGISGNMNITILNQESTKGKYMVASQYHLNYL